MADRKAARRKAVESALAAARSRDASGGQTGATSATSSGAVPAALYATHNFTPSAVSVAEHPSTPSEVSHSSAPMGYPEAPSASSHTLGVANVEYPPHPAISDGTRRKRYMSAAFLGVSLAAGVVGVVLIISTAVL